MFEKCLDKADHTQSHAQRMRQAAELMDKKLGKEWRAEANPDDVEFIEFEIVEKGSAPLDEAAAKKFYETLNLAGDAEGLGEKGTDAPEEGERCGDKKKQFMDTVMSALEKYLG